MIGFRDFVPKMLKSTSYFFSPAVEYESLESAVTAAGEWIDQSGIKVLQIETVVLPDLDKNTGSNDPALEPARATSTFYQFVRIWFEHTKATQPYR